MSERMIGQPKTATLRRLSGPAEVVRDRIISRHGGLWEHNPRAVEVAAEALVAFSDVANGHLAGLRCDRTERIRQLQADGTTGYQSEDIVAVALEDEMGRDAVVAWARVLMAEIGYEVIPASVTPEEVLEAAAVVAEAGAAAVADTNRAASDGHFTSDEAIVVAKRCRRLEDAAVTLRVSAWQAAKKEGL